MVHLDEALHGLIADLRKSGRFVGRSLETLLIIPPREIPGGQADDGGVGRSENFTPELMEAVGSVGMREALRSGVTSYTHASDLKDAEIDAPTRAVAEAVLRGALAARAAQAYLASKNASSSPSVKTLTLVPALLLRGNVRYRARVSRCVAIPDESPTRLRGRPGLSGGRTDASTPPSFRGLRWPRSDANGDAPSVNGPLVSDAGGCGCSLGGRSMARESCSCSWRCRSSLVDGDASRDLGLARARQDLLQTRAAGSTQRDCLVALFRVTLTRSTHWKSLDRLFEFSLFGPRGPC